MQDYNNNELDLKQFLCILSEYRLFIKTKLKKILIITFLFALIGYILETFIRNEEYQADLTFVVEEEYSWFRWYVFSNRNC